MDGDVAGVRIDPPIVEFPDAAVGKVLQTELKVLVISKGSKKIRFHAPVTDKFRLIVENPTGAVAPGMVLYATVEYESDVAEDARDRIILTIDEDIVEIPLYAYTPTPLLDLEGPANFGVVVANSKVISKEVALINHGSMPGEFNITYNGKIPLVIAPMKGKVNAKTIQLIKVEIITEKPCEINEVAKVALEGLQSTELIIKGSVVEQELQVLSNDGSPLQCVPFGPAYYGTDKIYHAMLHNNGPDEVQWVSVLQEDVDGQEAGTDLTKSTAATLATSPMERIRGKAYDHLTSLVTVIPNQGKIGPYQKIPVCFRFSPRFNGSLVGWESTEKPPPRQDFSLFISFDMIGSNDSFLSAIERPKRHVEVAVTATAVPVLVNILPSNMLYFNEIESGNRQCQMCSLVNESSLLPLDIEFRKIAHFDVSPSKTLIEAGETKDFLVTFHPRQAGNFRPIQVIDVVGDVMLPDGLKISSKQFQEIPMQYIASARPIYKKQDERFPKSKPQTIIKNRRIPDKQAVLVHPDERFQSIRPSDQTVNYKTPFTGTKRYTYIDPDYAYDDEEGEKKKEHKQKYVDYLRRGAVNRKESNDVRAFKAHNNDVDLGITPGKGLIPPKISSQEIETEDVSPPPVVPEENRLLTTKTLATHERSTAARPVSDGLNAVPTTSREKRDCLRKLTPQDLHKIIIGPPTIDFCQVCMRSTNVKHLNIINNLNQHIHVQVTIDCKELRQTSPLSQVVPPFSKAQLGLVFESSEEGKFQRSIRYTVNGQNESHILVLANVVPVALELSTKKLVLQPTFESPAEAGYRSVVTLYNRRNYAAEFNWSPILTERGTAFSIRPATGVVEAFKDLKCEVVFHPSYFAPLEGNFSLQVRHGNTLELSCIANLGQTHVQFSQRRIQFGSVPLNMRTVRTAVLRNHGKNHALFYVVNSNPFPGVNISPVHGSIPVGGNAELKVYLQPNSVMKFDTWIRVNIRGWKTIDLRMGGTVEPPCVDIDEKAFKFGGIYRQTDRTLPFYLTNLTPTRVKVDFDLSKYMDFHLSFPEDEVDSDQSTDLELLPNTYSVELAGHQTLKCKLKFLPTSVASYDFILPVNINKTSAPSPSPSTFPPTPAPSERHIVTPKYEVFSVATPGRRITATALRPILTMSSDKLDFSTPLPITEKSMPDHAVGDRKVLTLTNNGNESLKWKLDVAQAGKFLEDASFVFLKTGGANFTPDDVSGTLDPSESYELTIVFCPRRSGSFSYKIPLFLIGVNTRPHRFLELSAIVKPPKIMFDPLALVLTPVPLKTAVYAEFNIIASGYHNGTKLTHSIPEIELSDGSKTDCFSLEFPNGSTIEKQSDGDADSTTELTPSVLHCILRFSAHKPLSTCIDIAFFDSDHRKFTITVTATADNCLLTVYPFLAAHKTDHQIVCQQDKTVHGRMRDENPVTYGEAVILPCASPNRASTTGSTSATSSHFGATSSTYDSSSEMSDSSSSCSSRQAASSQNDEAVYASPVKQRPISNDQGLPATVDRSQMHAARQDLLSRSLGSAAFPFDSSIEAHFHLEVLQAVQRWFSNYGWPGGPFPITVPHTVRGLVTRLLYDDSDNAPISSYRPKPPSHEQKHQMIYASGDSGSLRKDVKTIYDMLHHLCGRAVPGIPINQPLPRDPMDRVIQLHWQHSTLLTFLKGQGASVAAIRPEFLFTPKDYKRWVKYLEREARKDGSSNDSFMSEILSEKNDRAAGSFLNIEEELFESVSKRAWTDLFLQIVKVMVLSRVTAKLNKDVKAIDGNRSFPPLNTDPLASNVYSVGERAILSWMNQHYENQRHKIWGERIDRGGVPPSRWVVNFDYDLLDGMVLAAVTAAYCPWLIKKFFVDMYTSPSSPEQCLHNTLIVVNAFAHIGLDYDIQATDITDPNPITLLMLCIHLYQQLPQYVAKSKVYFSGALHSVVHRQVRITNPSSRPIVYRVSIWGRDASDFYIPHGNEISIPARTEKNLDIEFASRYLRPAEAVLVLVSRREAAYTGSDTKALAVGATLVFNLETIVDDITPLATIKSQTPCYELEKIDLKVVNPFPEGGNFKIILIESNDAIPTPIDVGRVQSVKSKKSTLSTRIKSVKSRIDHGQKKVKSGKETVQMLSEMSSPDEATVADFNTLGGANPNRPISEDPMTAIGNHMTAFFCKESYIFLETETPTVLKVEFLPFRCGKKYCSILFSCPDVGEFLYAIEAVSNLPLPSPVPFNPNSSQSVRISSAAAAESGKGLFGGNERVVYWKCESGTELAETLLLPVTNAAKEKALIKASHQRMSDKEKQRRAITGTLESGTVTANLASMGLYSYTEPIAHLSAPPPPAATLFSVESSSECFNVPSTLDVPSPLTFGPVPASEIRGSKFGPNDMQDDGTVPLLVRFKPRGPGHYPCDIILRSPGDIRVYRIECTVAPAGTIAHFEFKTPAHQSVTQNIPIQNASNHDWDLECVLIGEGFSAPSHLLAKCGTTVLYPLTFNPQFECDIQGKLVVRNRSDGTEHVFHLHGIGKRPLALGTLEIHSQCHKTLVRSVDVPNYSPKKLVYMASSNLPFLDGAPTITVLPGQTGSYTFQLCPWFRGKYSGMLSFQGQDGEKNLDKSSDSDSDDEDAVEKFEGSKGSSDSSTADKKEYRVWYTIHVQASPAPPVKKIEVVCSAQKSCDVEIPIRNPTASPITFSVSYSDCDLTGPTTIRILPAIAHTYHLTYSPDVVGHATAYLIFQSEATGEFWYELDLHAVPPTPVTLPKMECELGRSTRQYMNVKNTTNKPMRVTAEVSNKVNFALDVDCENELPVVVIPPSSEADIPVQFTPTALGERNHTATVTLTSPELGDMVFWLSGKGHIPKPMEPLCMSALVNSHTSLIVPFSNPSDVSVFADISICDIDHSLNQMSESVIRNNITEDSSFCLLLKHTTGIRLGPKQLIDIPITFSPDKMRLYEGALSIALRREDDKFWDDEDFQLQGSGDDASRVSRVNNDRIRSIRWIFPIRGIPEVHYPESKKATLRCQARSRIEARLEVTLSGAVPSPSLMQEMAKLRAVTPLHKRRDLGGGINEGQLSDEFSFTVEYPSEQVRMVLEPALTLSLVRKERNPHSGIVSLIFNVIFAPFRTFRHSIQLLVTSTTGGMWRFPMNIKALECPVDDVIQIQAAGLKKPSTTAFRLFSPTRYPSPFSAFFISGSDPELTVSPQLGEMLPLGTEGTKIEVTFKPNMYGRTYKGKLVVQTLDMQWTYEICGVTPEYKIPTKPSAILSGFGDGLPRQTTMKRPRVNFVKKNLKIVATAVSSPIKGAPLTVKYT